MSVVSALGVVVGLLANNLHVKVGDNLMSLTEFFDTEAMDEIIKELEK